MGYTALAEAQGLADSIPVNVAGERVDTRPPLPTLPKVAPDNVQVAPVGRGGWLFTGNTRPTTDQQQGPATAPSRDGRSYRGLSPRHVEILQQIADTGGTNDEVGQVLHLSTETVKSHLYRACRKLGAADRAHAVALALRAGWIT